jgi:hypothetical protein
MKKLINGKQEEWSLQMKFHSPNEMGDTQLNRKNRREGKTRGPILVTNCYWLTIHNWKNE